MDDLTNGSEPAETPPSRAEDSLANLIAREIAARDRTGAEIDFDEIVSAIERDHPSLMLRLGLAPARKAVRLMVRNYCRRLAAMDPESDDGPQLAIPGLERVPLHIAYTRESDRKVVTRHTEFATRAQHVGCLELKDANVTRCVNRRAQQKRIIDLLDSTGCDTLHEWQQRFGAQSA